MLPDWELPDTELYLGTMTEGVFNQMTWWTTRRLGEQVGTTITGEAIYNVYIKWSEWNDHSPGNSGDDQ